MLQNSIWVPRCCANRIIWLGATRSHSSHSNTLNKTINHSNHTITGYPYYYLHQFTGEHFQEHPQPPAYPQQYQAQPWNQIVQPDYRLRPEYPQYQQPHVEYPPVYVDQFQQHPQFYQDYGNPQFIPVDQYGQQYNPPPQIEVLPQFPPQYESFPQYNHPVENLPGNIPNHYPQNFGDLPYHLNAPVQYPQYPMTQEKIPEVGSSYLGPRTWSGPIKYYIDDRGKLSPPMDPMGNIIYSGQQGNNPFYGTAGVGWAGGNQNHANPSESWPVIDTNNNNNAGDVVDDGGYLQPADTHNQDADHEADVADPVTDATHHEEEEIYVDECDQLSCYSNCRISLQGGGGCINEVCKCYPKDGIRRPEDNIWFELSEADQKRILDIENRFEAVPAVLTTKIFADTNAQTTTPTPQPKVSTMTKSTTTLEPTDEVEDFHTSKTTPDDIFSFDDATTEDIFLIDAVEGGENPVDDYDDSTAWDDGSGAIDDEDSETDSWWG